MKRSIAILLLLAMILGVFAGCGKAAVEPTEAPTVATEAPTEGMPADAKENLAAAAEYLKTFYKDALTLTARDYTRIGSLRIGLEQYPITWSVDVAEDIIKIVVNDDGTVTIDIADGIKEETPYVLTATLTDDYGNVETVTFEYTIPASLGTMQEIVDMAYALQPGEALEVEATLTGEITTVNTPYDASYKNVTVTIKVAEREDFPIECYRLKGEGADTITVGDTITVTGILKNYNGKIEFDAGCKLEEVVKGNFVFEVPSDPKEVVDMAYALGVGESMPVKVTLTGKITDFDKTYDASYNNSSPWMVVEGREGKPILCYRLTGDGIEDLAVGDTITVTGTITNYNGKIEFAQGCTFTDRVSGGGTPPAPPTSNFWSTIVEPGKTYYLYMNVGGVNYYFTGYTDSKYLPSSTNVADAVEVTVEADGEYGRRFTFTENGTKYYIEAYESGFSDKGDGKGSLRIVTEPTATFYYNGDAHTYVVYGTGTNAYFMGTYGTYTTFSCSSTYYITGVNAPNAGVTQYIANFMDPADAPAPEEKPDEPEEPETPVSTLTFVDAPVVGTAYKFAMQQNGIDGKPTLGITGEMNDFYFATSDDVAKMVDVYLEEAEGGYHIYFMNGETKTYVDIIVRENDATKTNVVFQTSGEHSVYVLNTEFKYVKTTVNDVDWYLGTFSTNNTISSSKTSYIEDTSKIGVSQFCAWFGIPAEGGSTEPSEPTVQKLTIAEAAAMGAAMTHDTTTTEKYEITGVIENVASTTYGNMTITDGNGNSLYIYGTYSADGSTRYDKMEVQPVAGDTVTLVGVIGNFNGAQMKNGWIVDHIPAASEPDQPEEPDVPVEPEQPAEGLKEGVAYNIKAENGKGTLWFNGTVSSGRFNGTYTESEAASVYVENVEGGFLLYILDGTTKTYICMADSTSGGSLSTDAAAATVFEWNAAKETAAVAEDSNNRAFGCQATSTYDTFSAYDLSGSYNWGQFVAVEGGSTEPDPTPDPECKHTNIKVEGAKDATCTEAGHTGKTVCVDCEEIIDAGKEIPVIDHTYVDGKCECGAVDPNYTPDQPKVPEGAPVAGTAYKLYVEQGNLNKTLYFAGTTANAAYYLKTTENVDEAVDVYVEEVDGGYRMYFDANGTKTYIDAYMSGTYLNARLTTSPTAVFTYNAEYNTLVTAVNGKEVYIGSYKTYNTLSASDFSYISTSFPSHLAVVGGSHEHDYVVTTTANCTTAGTTTYTCECGDTYTEETEALGHVDANQDVECDREGCTTKIAPPAESLLSNFTANCVGSKVSTSNQYYVQGTIVEVLDAKNGIFLIDDGTGETFYFRLPKNADGVSHASWAIKLTLGDKVKVYGKINKYTTSDAPNGQYWPAIQSGVVTVLEQHPHDYTYSPADCRNPATCACGQTYGAPRGCVDADANDICDDCGKNTKYAYEYVEIRTDNNSGVIDTTAGTYTWTNSNFDVQVAKGTSTQLYSTAKDHMRLYKGNQFVLVNKNGLAVKSITVYLTNATQIGNFEKFLTGYTYTTNADDFSVTVVVDSTETITLSNTGSTTQIKGVEFGYEKEATVDKAVEEVIALIDAIGEVTAESEEAIVAARAAYDALTDEQKALVTNLETLTAAEAAYEELTKVPSYVKISTAEELTTGSYVLVVSNGYAPANYSSGWVLNAVPVIENDVVTDTKNAVWTLTVNGNSVTLTDPNGVVIKPKGGNNNGVSEGAYEWTWVLNSDGTFSFKGTGSDTVTFACNTDGNNGLNRFRGYKNTTVSGNTKTYLANFTLYKLS